MRFRQSGFNLVELLIGISIAAMLLVLAAPGYQEFMANTQIRNAAESVATGLRTAQAAAIKRNTNCNAGSPNTCVEFVLDPANGWDVIDQSGPTTLESFRWALSKSYKSAVTPTPGASRIVSFNSLGRIVDPNPRDGSGVINQVDVTAPELATPHSLRVLVTPPPGTPGMVLRLCDPALPNTDTKGCP
jgi:type IV fimbrial biogenesis protein FimT